MDDGELLCASSVGHVEVGRVLIRHGADPTIPTSQGKTALQVAEEGARRQAGNPSDDCSKDYEAVTALLRQALSVRR